jgi:hypothetical protein
MLTRSSTFNSSLRLLAFVTTAVLAIGALECYCRKASRFQDTNHIQIRHLATADPTNGVFGDSHVLWVSYIPGFSFFGTAGQLPSELKTIVKYLYESTPPRKVILEADPQWVGNYHVNQLNFFTRENLISRRLPLLLTSAFYYKTLASNIASTVGNSILNLTTRPAQMLPGATPQPNTAEGRWYQQFGKPGFNWSVMSQADRAELTAKRVQNQNPIDGFQTSRYAVDLLDAVNFLALKGAEVCLFRTPVTDDYLTETKSTPHSNYGAYESFIKRFADEHHMKYIDFRDLPYTFSDQKFLNPDHMSNSHYAEVWPLVKDACFE